MNGACGSNVSVEDVSATNRRQRNECLHNHPLLSLTDATTKI